MSIFYKEDKVKIVDTILDHIQKMFTRQHDLSVYIITKSIGEISDYKVKPLAEDEKKREKRLKDLKCTEQEYMAKALPANIQLAEKMRRRGKFVSASQRIEYVITNPKNHIARQFDKIEDVEYVREHSDVVCIDPLYYLKLMSKSLDEVLFVGLKLPELVTRQYKYRLLKHKMLDELHGYFNNNYRIINT
jgi:DNA polymerase elongation subunit (family B)